MENIWIAIVWSLLPTIVVSLFFYYIMRSIVRADRKERRVYAQIEAEERAKGGLPPVQAAAASGPADG